ncbi:MAG: sulfate adenylyltransferase [Desulfobacteraceae bacterium]|jgi:sulfate adenylyltransferase|nr:sulfate adenylyltransferase [Desulfobacteraceae bacterium]MDH3572759.1 sulfate adenylyltransferase [Desulfobacteraceae bacterium]MDH3720412.1 sulfate adenylyltransferase [Desulfobacteraceae bacterium]MDH3836458.1 sulfate adenylyltransferase [Desulfobacteraceae bacterium]MDH3872918.1 sulfate adenylyltransferase [Desulfobacteraceae bacterium]
MSKLIPPHGGKGLTCCLLEGAELDAEKKKAEGLKKITVSHREVGDLIMMGIGGFSPLTGFMTKADWKGVCENFQLADGTFWPIPVTLSVDKADADSISDGDEIALCDPDTDEIMGTMKVAEKYELTEADKKFECEKIYKGEGTPTVEEFWKIAGEDHPGVQMVMAQKPFNLAGTVKVLSEGDYPEKYAGVYMRPEESRKIFEEKGWSEIAALQLRNPMHRSHEYLCKIAVEVCDGVYIHSLVGNLKPGDIPAEVRVECIDSLVKNYFVEKNVVQGGYPLDMRYAGPREGLLHATFRQNYGCSRMIIGRDHAGVGDFYGMFEAQTIFDKIPTSDDPGKNLLCQPLKIDWTFYCYKCDGMASLRTCPHGKDDRVLLSGTMLRKMLSEGGELPDHFGRDEVVAILRKYYEGLEEKVEIKMHSAATGDDKK